VLRGLRATREDQERVRITTLHSLSYTWLLPRLPAFVAAHPRIRLTVDAEIALARFDDGGPDLGIRYGPGHWPGLTAHHLMDDAMFPVASPNLPGLANVTEPSHVARLLLISDLSRQGWHDWFRAAGVHGVKLDERYIFSDATSALNAATFGIGAAREDRGAVSGRGAIGAAPGPDGEGAMGILRGVSRAPAPPGSGAGIHGLAVGGALIYRASGAQQLAQALGLAA
jgi:DNA-binding transcriptional LysR family regulator